jgi:hypothetical protein
MNRFQLRHIIFFLSFGAALTSCSEQHETLFTKLDPSATGIDFINENHETEKTNILSYEYYYNGGGVAIGDINNDVLTNFISTKGILNSKTLQLPLVLLVK